MNFRYITIEREYGSGGTEIARQIAEMLICSQKRGRFMLLNRRR